MKYVGNKYDQESLVGRKNTNLFVCGDCARQTVFWIRIGIQEVIFPD
jgi:hypothetical protein